MIRGLWYLFKIVVVAGVVVYLSSLPGDIAFMWGSYKVEIRAGIAALLAFFVLLIVFLTADFLAHMSLWPERIVRFNRDRRRVRGYQALIRSLTASAAGDYKLAYYQAHRAHHLLPDEEQALPLLLEAQSQSRLHAGSDDEALVREPYHMLLKNPETALLGLQGLAQNAIMTGDFTKALLLAREALKQNPRNYSLLRSIYDLELKNQLWSDALLTLEQAQKRKVIDRSAANRDRGALYLALGFAARDEGRTQEARICLEKSLSARAHFVPGVCALARLYLNEGERRKALSLVKAAWCQKGSSGGHPEFLPVWFDLAPEPRAGREGQVFEWMSWVDGLRPHSLAGKIGLAQAAIADGLWGEARQALADAEKIRPCAEIYRLWVQLEEKTSGRADVIRAFLDRSYQAPAQGVWVCQKTLQHFEMWVPFVASIGQFNTLEWIEKPQLSVATAMSFAIEKQANSA
ncbi:MAG: heme biosynthesis HemY N-terminal domain-containing protein [Pseudobdellovibrionaceae bacterium]